MKEIQHKHVNAKYIPACEIIQKYICFKFRYQINNVDDLIVFKKLIVMIVNIILNNYSLFLLL